MKAFSRSFCLRVGIMFFLIALIAVVFIFMFMGEKESLQYETVKDVTFQIGYPPFTTFTLSNAEINALLDKLSSTNFSSDTMVPNIFDGDGITCTITTTDAKSYQIHFLRPYCTIGKEVYELDRGEELFQVVEQLMKKHLEGGWRHPGNRSDPDIPVPVENTWNC